MNFRIHVPSGVEISLTALFRQVASLTPEDIDWIFITPSAKPFRKPVGELLGRSFASLYNSRRVKAMAGRALDFWKLRSGAFRSKFIDAAVNARRCGLDFEMLMLCAEAFVRKSKHSKFPAPSLACGDYVFGEVLNGWTPVDDAPAPADVIDELPPGEGGWTWEPGTRWDEKTGMFVTDDN